MSLKAEALNNLWRWGHFSNPRSKTAMSEDDEREAAVHSKRCVEEAVLSFQTYYQYDLNFEVQRLHGRPAMLDGDPGPITQQLIDRDRCDYPDYPVDRPDIGLTAAMMRQEESNWPPACRDDVTTAYHMNLQGLSAEQLEALWLEALLNWSNPLAELVMKLVGWDDSPRIRAQAGPLQRGVLAWSHLAQNSCAANLEQRYNSNLSWRQTMFVTVATHELGHALGFDHNQDRTATMYPSIHEHSIARRGYPNRTDLIVANRNGYQINPDHNPPGPQDPNKPPPPPPTPPTQEVSINAVDVHYTVGGQTYVQRLSK